MLSLAAESSAIQNASTRQNLELCCHKDPSKTLSTDLFPEQLKVLQTL